MYEFIRNTCILVTLVCPSYSQDVVPAIEHGLARPLQADRPADLTTKGAFVTALIGAELPGGIELLEDCNTKWITLRRRPSAISAWDLLQEIVMTRPDLAISVSPDGLIHIASRENARTILDVRIENVTIADRSNLPGALDSLLRTTEVQTEMKNVNLKEPRISRRAGFSAMQKPGGAKRNIVPITLAGISLREALDQLVRISHKSMWSYVQNTCGSERTFSISFDVQ